MEVVASAGMCCVFSPHLPEWHWSASLPTCLHTWPAQQWVQECPCKCCLFIDKGPGLLSFIFINFFFSQFQEIYLGIYLPGKVSPSSFLFPCTRVKNVKFMHIIIIIISVLPKGRSFTANSSTKAAILPKCRSSIANSGT